MTALDFDRLHGVWAGLPVAWDDRMELDEEACRADVETLCRAGVQGVYTGGTTGEFYAQDEDTFARLVDLTAETAHEHDTPMQAGCTALSTRLVIRRIDIAREAGADGIQVALPFWLALSDDEVVAFFRDVAVAAGETPLILYRTERSKRLIDVDLFCRIKEIAPNLIGCKYTGADLDTLARLCEALPDVSVFASEHLLADAMRRGARGNYSSWVYLNPGPMLAYYEACRQGRWAEAEAFQADLKRFYGEGIRFLVDKGVCDTGIDRVFATVRGVLRCGLRCQPPYACASPEDVETLRAWMEQHTPDLLE